MFAFFGFFSFVAATALSPAQEYTLAPFPYLAMYVVLMISASSVDDCSQLTCFIYDTVSPYNFRVWGGGVLCGFYSVYLKFYQYAIMEDPVFVYVLFMGISSVGPL